VVTGTVPQGGQLVARDSTNRAWPLVAERTSLPPGRYTLEFRAAGYDAETRQLVLQAGQTETWSPAMRATAKAAPPTTSVPAADPRADQQAIESLVRAFHASFSQRDTSVVRLMQGADRANWSRLMVDRNTVTDFSAALGTIEQPRVTGDNGTIVFAMNVAFRSGNQNVRQPLRYLATARRTPGGWQLISVAAQR
jgi:hypothetical protein